MKITSLTPYSMPNSTAPASYSGVKKAASPQFGNLSEATNTEISPAKRIAQKLLQVLLWPLRTLYNFVKRFFKNISGYRDSVVEDLNKRSGQKPEDTTPLSPPTIVNFAGKQYSIQPEALKKGFEHLGRNYYKDDEGRCRSALRVLAMANPLDSCVETFKKRLSPKEIEDAYNGTQVFLQKLAASSIELAQNPDKPVLQTGCSASEVAEYLKSLSRVGTPYNPDSKRLPSFESLLQSRQWINALSQAQGNPDTPNWLPKPMALELKK